MLSVEVSLFLCLLFCISRQIYLLESFACLIYFPRTSFFLSTSTSTFIKAVYFCQWSLLLVLFTFQKRLFVYRPQLQFFFKSCLFLSIAIETCSNLYCHCSGHRVQINFNIHLLSSSRQIHLKFIMISIIEQRNISQIVYRLLTKLKRLCNYKKFI